MTQSGQNIELGSSNAQEIETRLQQILESMRTPTARADNDEDGAEPDTNGNHRDNSGHAGFGNVIEISPAPSTSAPASAAKRVPNSGAAPAETESFPPFMRLPSQTHSVTRLGQAMVERGLITQDDLDRALDHQRTTRKRLGEVAHRHRRGHELPALPGARRPPRRPVRRPREPPARRPPRGHDPRGSRAPLLRAARSSVGAARSSSRWPTRTTSSRSTTSACSRASRSSPRSPTPATSSPRSTTPTPAPTSSRAQPRRRGRRLRRRGRDRQGALVDDGPVVKLVNALLEKAVADRASDLHIEPASKNVMIRMRIDGILHDTSEAPLNVLRPMVSRLKVMGSLDISQNRLPQDGRFSLSLRAARSTCASRPCRPRRASRSCSECSTPCAARWTSSSLGPLRVRERTLRHRVPRAAGRDLRYRARPVPESRRRSTR